MSIKDHLKREKPWAVLGWTRKQWKRSRIWKQAGVSEEKMAKLVVCLDHETVQKLKDGAQADALIEKIFGTNLSE